MENDSNMQLQPGRERLPFNKWLMVTAVGLLLATGSLVLYMKFGNPSALDSSEYSKMNYADSYSSAVHQEAGDIAFLLEGLKEKLYQNPDNGPGWALLARSYVELKRHSEALPAFREALKHIPDDPQLLVDYADAIGMVNGGIVNNQAKELIATAMRLDPNNTKALLLAATVAYDQKDYGQAVRHWETVLEQDGLEPSLVQEVQTNIAEVNAFSPGGVIPAKFVSSRPSPTFISDGRIQGMVEITQALGNEVSESDTLFIFAKPVRGPSGPPVAVLRTDVHPFPFTFELNDSHQVLPGKKLSDSGEVIIVARISKNGDAMAQSGDLEGKSQPIRVDNHRVNVLIDRKIP